MSDTLRIECVQRAPDGALLSSTTLEYPGSMPNEQANLFNLTTTLHLTLVALRAALGKAIASGGDPVATAELSRLEKGLSALVGTSISPGQAVFIQTGEGAVTTAQVLPSSGKK